MKKIFIIGNGFDTAHGLHTSYEDFRRFLCDQYIVDEEMNDAIVTIPEVSIGPKGDLVCDEDEVADFLIKIISVAEPNSEYWSELEASLGRLDYSEVFDLLPDEFDEDGDLDDWKTVYNNEDMASTLMVVVPYIKEFFTEWINEIELCDIEVKRGFQKLVGESDLFLTFNYTETLEACYAIKEENICHIHGKQGKEILFGHGNCNQHTDEYMRKFIGAEDMLDELDSFLKKDTKSALKEYSSFFEKIDQTVDAIYTVGFSFGDVDLIYIKEICKKLSDKVVWYLNDYDSSKLPIYQSRIRQCGFKGIFDTFSV